MKRVVITVITLIFSVSFCMAQNIKQESEKEKERQALEQQKIQAKKQQQDADYNVAIASAKKNVEDKRYEQAKKDYERAIEFKPENKNSLNPKIAEIDKLIATEKAAERERKYQAAITSAQRNVEYERYELAKEDYLTAFGIKPENADFINEQISKIESKVAHEKEVKAAAERERLYQEAIASAARNFKQGRYEQARDDYRDALGLKPENRDFINRKIAELDKPATLYIYRKSFWNGGSTHKYNIYLDNKVVCESKNSLKKAETVTTFGTKTISATIENRKAEVRINFEPGGIYYLRSSVKTGERPTGKYKTVTTPVYTSSGSIFKGTYKSEQTGTKTETVPVTETYYTPILEEVNKSVGEAEYDAIKDRE